MNDSTPELPTPSEETLQFIRAFARTYRPQKRSAESSERDLAGDGPSPMVFC